MQLVSMKIFGEQGTLKLSFNTVFRKVKNKIISLYEKKNPDAIVSTYFAPYHIACCAKAKNKINTLKKSLFPHLFFILFPPITETIFSQIYFTIFFDNC